MRRSIFTLLLAGIFSCSANLIMAETTPAAPVKPAPATPVTPTAVAAPAAATAQPQTPVNPALAKYKKISPLELNGNIIKMVNKQWMLVTAGKADKFNSMTAGWGGIGVMWSKPVAFILVRNTRYTYEFLEREPNFTLTFFPEKCRQQLVMFGTKSGRNVDKVKESGFKPFDTGMGMAYEEANIIIACKKIYAAPVTAENAINPDTATAKFLSGKDYHKLYFGEIVGVWIKQ